MMTNLKLGVADWYRKAAKEARVFVRNRYFEQNPTNLDEGSSLLRRPALKRVGSVGDGPCRGVYSQPGSFDTCAFIASGSELYRYDGNDTATFIGGGLAGTTTLSNVSMAATGNIGSTPEYLYVADGQTLYLYMANSYGFGTLSGVVVNGDKVSIGGVFYQWTNASVDTGTPAGTNAAPWLVKLGDAQTGSFENLAMAIASEGVPGVTYSTLLSPNPVATYQSFSQTQLGIRTEDTTTPVALTITTGAGLSWSSSSIVGGGPSWTTVQVPDGLGVISVAYIASFVIVVVSPSTNFKGRFFWIQPGETIIRPLNFATAESSPDPTYSVLIVGDQIWFPAQASTEIWYPTAQADVPFARVQGQLFDRGTWEGTAVQVKENLFIVDNTGAVFNLNGGLKRISDPSIEERVRAAMMLQLKDT